MAVERREMLEINRGLYKLEKKNGNWHAYVGQGTPGNWVELYDCNGSHQSAVAVCKAHAKQRPSRLKHQR